jgi:pimeloyl-ACP methyl ester carboxylesterase
MRRRFVANNPYALRAKTAQLLDTPDRTDELAALAATGFPVGVLYGPADDAWPTSWQDRVAAAVGTTAQVVVDAGHSPAAEQPERTAEVLDTLWRGFVAGQGG